MVENVCLADPNHLKARLTLIALHYYEGDNQNFNIYAVFCKNHPLCVLLHGHLSYLFCLNCISIGGHYLIVWSNRVSETGHSMNTESGEVRRSNI